MKNQVVIKLIVPAEDLAEIAAALLQKRAASGPRVDRITLNSGGDQ